MTWLILGALGVLGYLQRMLPWVLAERTVLPPWLAAWLRYVAPAAFATLLVTDVQHWTWSTGAALLAAGLTSWRTRNLGLAVMAALLLSLIGHSL